MKDLEIKKVQKLKKGDSFSTLYDKYNSYIIHPQNYIVHDHYINVNTLVLKKPKSTFFGIPLKWKYRYVRYDREGNFIDRFFEYYLYEEAI